MIDDSITVVPSEIKEILQVHKNNGFTFFAFMTCVDHLHESSLPRWEGQREGDNLKGVTPHLTSSLGLRPGRPFPARGEDSIVRFELVYQLRDMSKPSKNLRVRTFLPAENPSIESVGSIYHPAYWDEREVYDMFGINFSNHPDLTRILMPDDWIGHPLRRDFPVGGEAVDFSEDFEEWQTAPPKA